MPPQKRVKVSGRIGEVVRHDPDDADLTYKLRFSDGGFPEADWFKEAEVEDMPSPIESLTDAPQIPSVESIGTPLPLGSITQLPKRTEEEQDEQSNYPIQEWQVPSDHLHAAAKGDKIESHSMRLRGLDCEIKMRFWPRGVSKAKEGYCSAYIWSSEDVSMQLQVHVNGHSRKIDDRGAVMFKAGDDRGYAEFCVIQDTEVTMRVELLTIGAKVLAARWRLPEDHYQLGRVLGTGAYGSVREGRDIHADRDVAVKRTELGRMSKTDTCRILREVQLLRELDHSHVTKIYDAFMPEGRVHELYIVMERCEADLKKVCELHSGISMPQARRLSYNLLVGCSYLHSQGVYHRDLKPANCLANRDCSVKICDFNLARSVDALQATESDAAEPPQALPLSRTLTKHMVTRWYRAPEVILQLPYSEALDVWSAGCIIGELLRALNTDGRLARSRPLFEGGTSMLSTGLAKHGDQLDKIIDVLGTPFDDPEFAKLPGDAQEQMRFYTSRSGCGVASLVPAEHCPDALELLEEMLRFFPQKRIPTATTLHHKFFEKVRRSKAEEEIGDGQLDLCMDVSQIRSRAELIEKIKQEVKECHAGAQGKSASTV